MEPTNNQSNMNNMPNMSNVPQQAPVLPQKPASSAGTIVAVVVILTVLVIGGFYFWGQNAGNDEYLNTVNQQSTSDMEADIEADLEATDVENVDYDLNPDNFNAS